MQNRRFYPMGLANPGETHGLTVTGTGLVRQEPAGRVFQRFWIRTELSFRSKHSPLTGYPDLLLPLPLTKEPTKGVMNNPQPEIKPLD